MTQIFPQLEIPETLAAGPGPGNTDPRVLERFAKTGVADHMQKDVLRGMIEAKQMLRELWGTKNVYTYGVAGTGFDGLDCVLSMILPGDKVVCFPERHLLRHRQPHHPHEGIHRGGARRRLRSTRSRKA